MTLVVVIFLCKDGKEEITLHVKVGPSRLVKHAFIELLLTFLLGEVTFRGTQKEDCLSVISRDVEHKVSAGIGFHLNRGNVIGEDQFSFESDGLPEPLVVDAKEWVESTCRLLRVLHINGGAHLFYLDSTLLLLCHKTVRGRRLVTVHTRHHLTTTFLINEVRVIGFLYTRTIAEDSHRPITHLIGMYFVTVTHGPDASLDGHILFGLVA